MKLHDHQVRAYFAQYDIPVLSGEVVTTAQAARHIVQGLGTPALLHAQAGQMSFKDSIQRVDSPEEAEKFAEILLNYTVNGQQVEQILVEPDLPAVRSLFLGIAQDHQAAKMLLIASPTGGIEVEKAAFADPETVCQEDIEPLIGLRSYQVLRIASTLNLPRATYRKFDEIAQAMYACYVASDATVLEINPLILTPDDELIALDGKIVVDDNALFRQPELAGLRDTTEEIPSESLARVAGMTYIRLDGKIGCIVNGAGLGMATMDMIDKVSAGEIQAATFLDVAGGADPEKIKLAFNITRADPNVQVLLVNIFGGMTRCDEVAHGIIASHREKPIRKPLIVRLRGTSADEGKAILQDVSIPTLRLEDTLTQAVTASIQVVRGTV